jgi:hypothetical protein
VFHLSSIASGTPSSCLLYRTADLGRGHLLHAPERVPVTSLCRDHDVADGVGDVA